jgi:hypothetical protein
VLVVALVQWVEHQLAQPVEMVALDWLLLFQAHLLHTLVVVVELVTL